MYKRSWQTLGYAKSNNFKCLGRETPTLADNENIIMGFRGNSSVVKSEHTNLKVWRLAAKAGQMSVTVQCLKESNGHETSVYLKSFCLSVIHWCLDRVTLIYDIWHQGDNLRCLWLWHPHQYKGLLILVMGRELHTQPGYFSQLVLVIQLLLLKCPSWTFAAYLWTALVCTAAGSSGWFYREWISPAFFPDGISPTAFTKQHERCVSAKRWFHQNASSPLTLLCNQSLHSLDANVCLCKAPFT